MSKHGAVYCCAVAVEALVKLFNPRAVTNTVKTLFQALLGDMDKVLRQNLGADGPGLLNLMKEDAKTTRQRDAIKASIKTLEDRAKLLVSVAP
ncbi:Dynamin related protein [Klebsormidium nitens]|uniref:Dynamin related protein n=1 Tax=Klebsormidium nitens TaxID=105231 RepID=A0A1Y1II85_KLENI|nr:Dynamin related protein [Klebsormidium nitens]|eukprot:GAQ87858.1 Dynamin related protein [Klebsormidium nitens]